MKLYSLVVYHKNTSDNTVRAFKSAFDLASFSFFQRGSVQEFMMFTGKLVVERSELPSRSSVAEQEYMCHCYVRPDGLSAVVISDAEYPARVAFTMLAKLLDDFAGRVPVSSWPSIGDNAAAFDKCAAYLAQWQNPRDADAITRVQDEIDETKIILHNTIASVLDRGEKLDDLVEKSEGLSAQSKMFYKQASKMNKCCSWY